MRWLAILLTERDNKSPCIVRMMWLLVFFYLLCINFYAIHKGQALDFLSDTRAWCEFLGFASLGIAGKSWTEKKIQQEEEK